MNAYHKHGQKRVPSKYSLDEDKKLLDLREVQRLPWADIAEYLPNRRERSLASRYEKLRPQIDTRVRVLKKGSWTVTQTEELKRLVAAGEKNDAIAMALNKSTDAVRVKCYSLSSVNGNVDALQRQYTRQRWTPEEVARLLNLKSKGHTLTQIARRLGRTFDGIKLKIRNLSIEEEAPMLAIATTKAKAEEAETPSSGEQK